MSLRTKATDRALCLHEAAHAVVAEVLRPGCVIGVEMDYVPGTPCMSGEVFGGGSQAVCSWLRWSAYEMLVAVAAGRYGEEIAPVEIPHWKADDALLRSVCKWAWWRRNARRDAQRLVRKHELAIRRVAKMLGEKRTASGAEIREAAWL